jgi:hypothetical protein
MQGPIKSGPPPPQMQHPQQRRPSGADRLPIIEMKPGMKNICTKFIVLDKGKPVKVAAGPTLQQFLVADHTAAMFLTLYDEKAEAVDVSDIIEIRDGYDSSPLRKRTRFGESPFAQPVSLTMGIPTLCLSRYCSLYKGALTLYVGKQGRISRLGECVLPFDTEYLPSRCVFRFKTLKFKTLFVNLRFCLAFDESVNVSFFEWEEKNPGEFVRLSREQAESMPHHSRNIYVMTGASPNTVPS